MCCPLLFILPSSQTVTIQIGLLNYCFSMRWPCQHCLINIHVHTKSITIFLFHEPLLLSATKTADSTCCFPLYLNSFVANLFFYDSMKVSLNLPYNVWCISVISIHACSQLVYIHPHTQRDTHTHAHILLNVGLSDL